MTSHHYRQGAKDAKNGNGLVNVIGEQGFLSALCAFAVPALELIYTGPRCFLVVTIR